MKRGILTKDEMKLCIERYKVILKKSEDGQLTKQERIEMKEIDEKLVQHILRTDPNTQILKNGMIIRSSGLEQELLKEKKRNESTKSI